MIKLISCQNYFVRFYCFCWIKIFTLDLPRQNKIQYFSNFLAIIKSISHNCFEVSKISKCYCDKIRQWVSFPTTYGCDFILVEVCKGKLPRKGSQSLTIRCVAKNLLNKMNMSFWGDSVALIHLIWNLIKEIQLDINFIYSYEKTFLSGNKFAWEEINCKTTFFLSKFMVLLLKGTSLDF